MATRFYDEALLEKINKWTKDTAVTLVGPEETSRLYRLLADNNEDSPIKLPLISIRRQGGFSIAQHGIGKRPLSFDGLTLEANHEKALQLNAIPINIPYQLDVYTRYFDEADEYVRNIVFNIINYPKLEIVLPYNNKKVVHMANIRLMGEIENTSDIPERLVSGQFTRMTMRLDIDDAYLFDTRCRDVYSIDIVTDVSSNSIEDDSKNFKLI